MSDQNDTNGRKNDEQNGVSENEHKNRIGFGGMKHVDPDDLPTQVLDHDKIMSAQGQQSQPQSYPQGQQSQPQSFPQGQPPQPQSFPQGQPPQPQSYPQGQLPQPQNFPQGQQPQPQSFPQGQYPPPQNYRQGNYPPPPNRPHYNGGMQPPRQRQKNDGHKSKKSSARFLVIAIIILIAVMIVLVILVMKKSKKNEEGVSYVPPTSTATTSAVTTVEETEYEEITTLKALVEVPDVVEESLTVAKMRLSELGYSVKVKQEYSSSVPADHVISQSIEGGVKTSEGAVIELVVSKGSKDPDRSSIVPDVCGITLDEARQKLADAGLGCENGTDQPGGSMVAKQSIAAGTKVLTGTRIALVLAEETSGDAE